MKYLKLFEAYGEIKKIS